eukprot:CAMPEP_0197033626 /NCGR_PEP_ID=MMETSP1384-20130603/11990_1 /TAXON_ID=29189 /ORGANISM="Ammonia sp." /LENGTH=221 /DNA_ID=CAMNT_0042463465 /DNA_START=164 /DNA_END=828 /DNA_ORIENTATION=-
MYKFGSAGNMYTCSNSVLFYNAQRAQSGSTNQEQRRRVTIDEALLAKQEDPMVLKQKEELLRAFAAQLRRYLKRWNNSHRTKLKYLMKNIYGCTAIEIKQYCAMFGIHEQTPVKLVPPLFWAVLILHLNRVPRFGSENLLIEAAEHTEHDREQNVERIETRSGFACQDETVAQTLHAKEARSDQSEKIGIPVYQREEEEQEIDCFLECLISCFFVASQAMI